MKALIICILISIIANEYNNFPFDTIFTYISIAIQLYNASLRLQKNYNEHKQKKQKNANDTNNKNTTPDNPNITLVK